MKKKILIALIIIGYLSIASLPLTIYANENNQSGIIISPDKYLFDLSNIKPGDTAARILTIQNREKTDFTYISKAQFLKGSEKLYKEFLLKVWDSKEVLYNGKLSDFDGFKPRHLPSKSQEDLRFEVTFPYELGNEFQGLAFDFELRFIMEPSRQSPNPEPTPDPNPNQDPDPTTDPDPKDNNAAPPTNSETESDQGNDQNNNIENPVAEEDTAMPIPIRSIPFEELDAPIQKGQILPSTATNMYNYLLIGVILMTASGGFLLHQKRRIRDNKRP
ncbi:LPXTG cell wall anchor domain-containing protein [Bacillus sp. FJAT-29937]|uniref:LPXTG cell wall anchor domain-containing protein n=1 Tax=Bacillus sp. FJAT-29937 TaxID=1720553 RepID=UPI0008301957|nr:LPXTG cell wall anchor domain-containing protein [Bacillus sp. FJAT-29937]